MLTLIDAPTQVRNAFLLLWGSFALATIESVIALFGLGFSDDEPLYVYLSWLFLAIALVLIVANAYVIYCASRRRNWARIVLLALLLLSVSITFATRFMWSTELGDEDFWSDATTAAYFVMDAIALYWLFTGAGARWYVANDA
jgi:hypothetical protein